MRTFVASLVLALWATLANAAAPDISGVWQGKSDRERQYVLKITKAPKGNWRGDFYNLGPERTAEILNGNTVSSISIAGDAVSFSLDYPLGTFHGAISAGGKSLRGTWQATGQAEAITFEKATRQTEWVIDASPHKAQFVSVDKDVKLEVLDWGGSGPPLIFLSGNGNSAHVFDSFAPKFTAHHHVYGFTRRGFGASSWPAPTVENYDPDRLGDDILAAIDALKLDRPVLAGHSIAGEELSSIGTRHPEKVSGLIYLDAAYGYAYYDPKGEKSMYVTAAAIRRDIQKTIGGAVSQEARELVKDLQIMATDLQQSMEPLSLFLNNTPDRAGQRSNAKQQQVYDALLLSFRRYTGIKAPILAIFVQPNACQSGCDPGTKAFFASNASQIDAFEAGNPTARVVRLTNAQHYVFRSNEAEVMQEMNRFMDGLASH